MPLAGERPARAAMEKMRSVVGQLSRSTSPDEQRNALVASWSAAEEALRSFSDLTGTGATGQALIQEMRRRQLLSLREAHAFIDLNATAQRAASADYQPTAEDIALAQGAFDRLVDVVEGKAAVPEVPASAPVLSESTVPPVVAPAKNVLGRVIVVGSLLVAAAAVGAMFWMRRGDSGELERGRAAYSAGDRATAATAFRAAAVEHPALAEPHIFLGRMAREAGDFLTANGELRRAVELEPNNALTHRELAALLLATGQPELARAFYERAIRFAPEDKNALGYMGCTLMRLGRADLAARFVQRAGPGPWQACASPTVPPSPQ